MQSLLDYLRHENPPLNNKRCRPGSNTTCGAKQNWKQPRIIKPWEDFDYDSLKLIYGGALNAALQRQCQPDHPPKISEFPFCEIYDENSLEGLLVMWNQVIVSHALAKSQDEVNNQHIDDHVFMVKGGQAAYPGEKSEFRPDWAGIRRTHFLKKRAINVLPGDTKLSKKWTSRSIKLGQVTGDFRVENWLKPLTQIHTYCCRGNARYGYLLTDKELVVVRVRPDSHAGLKRNIDTNISAKPSTGSPAKRALLSGILEFKAIPWASEQNPSPDGSKGLTVNLALWWLHMLAAEDSGIEDIYPPLPDTVRKSRAKRIPVSRCFTRTPESKVKPTYRAPSYRQSQLMTPPSSGPGKKRARDSDDFSGELDLDDRRRLKARTNYQATARED